ncbi:UNVERIFIED_CONTAM: hypothetical protein GTU68_046412 [Idotea baltica]|nr:hypothetical protein [Idotea baltica]
MGDTQSGIRTLQIFPFRSCGTSFVSVYCDQTTDGGGWTVIQRREDLHEREDFYRDWAAYQQGFGSLGGEFWLGLDNIHALANQTKMELRVALEDYEGDKRWAKYDSFYITDSAGKYRLKLGKYEGNAGDSLAYHKDRPFSTKDVDNDSDNTGNCAQNRRGAWWYGECTDSNLNGFQYRGNFTSFADGIVWYKFRGEYYSLKSTVLSVRPAI